MPPSVGELGSLQELILEGCSALRALPDTLGGLSQVKTFNMKECSSLEALPPGVGELGSLQELSLGGCSALRALPDVLGRLSQLKGLRMWK